MNHTPILIVGAGPTGLMAACQLQRMGVPFRIIEKQSTTTHLSKALVMHARTLEIFQQMGIAQTAIDAGVVIRKFNLAVKGKLKAQVPLGDIGEGRSPFPFALGIEQSKTEHLLYQYLTNLGGQVEWQTEFVEFKEEADHIIAQIRHADGTTETLTADWIIGADGGKSPLRHQLNLAFKGDTYEQLFYVVDVEVDWKFSYEEIFVNLADYSFVGFFPIKDNKRMRLVGILPEQFKNEAEVKFEDIADTVLKMHQMPLTFGKVNWFSLYRVHHRHVEQFSKGRAFLAGDAAHVHSPAGGQGMNTGLQDAYNLTWKLALVVKGKSPQSLLDSYNAERLPVADKLVTRTDGAFTAIVSKKPVLNWFRKHIIPHIANFALNFQCAKKRVFNLISQTGVRYRKSPLSVNKIPVSNKRLQAGDRLPYFFMYNPETQQQESIYNRLNTTMFNVIIFNMDNNYYARELQDILNIPHPNYFTVHQVPNHPQNSATLEKLAIHTPMLVLVRPDNYVGYVGKADNVQELHQYLDTILLK